MSQARDIEITERPITQVVRLSARVQSIDLVTLCNHLNGDFKNPDCPNRFVAYWKGYKIIFTRNEIRTLVPMSLKEKLKEEFHKFVNDDVRRFIDEDVKPLKKDLGIK